MDPLTHALSGAALARALPGQPLPRSQVMLLIVLAMAPDADFVLKFISDAIYLEYHRGITHSVLMLPLWIWLIHALLPGQRSAAPLTPWLIGLALAMHILLDLITSFGTMIMAPFSDWRAALDLVFIIDPLFTGCLLLPLLLMLLCKKQARKLAITALVLMGGYLATVGVMHQKALDIARVAQPDAGQLTALPLPFSPFHWQLIASFPDHYRRASVNLAPGFSGTASLFPEKLASPYLAHIKPPESLIWQRLLRMDSLTFTEKLPGMDFYRWFARFPVLLEQHADYIEFGDLRFGAGIRGTHASFRLHIERGHKPRAWLVWRNDVRTELQ